MNPIHWVSLRTLTLNFLLLNSDKTEVVFGPERLKTVALLVVPRISEWEADPHHLKAKNFGLDRSQVSHTGLPKVFIFFRLTTMTALKLSDLISF